ncbi:hypothetical protein ABXS75_01985 [Roseburia hominis]
MKRFGAKNTTEGRNIYLSLIIFLVLIFIFLTAIHSLSGSSLEEQQKNLEQALVQSAVHCYAVEGSYPETLEQLLSRYNITYDESSFFIDYQTEGQNMMPDITVIRKK